MDRPLISIITPVYNAEIYLDECIESILRQTYTNIELILINDGSTDNSLNICKKWENRDKRVKVINKKNEGVAIARNKGIDEAKGELIGFVDSDDTIEPEMYDVMYQDMLNTDSDIIMCNSESNIDGKKIGDRRVGYNNFEIKGRDACNRFLAYDKLFVSAVWSKLYKKDAIGSVRFMESIRLGEDYCFNGMIYPQIAKLYYEDKVLYNYRIREGSLCRLEIDEHFFDKYRVAKILKKELSVYGFIEDISLQKFELSTLYEILYNLCIRNSDRKVIRIWKEKFNRQFEQVKRGEKINRKDYLKMFLLGHIPRTYTKITNKLVIK